MITNTFEMLIQMVYDYVLTDNIMTYSTLPSLGEIQKLIQMVYDYVLTDNMKAQNEQLHLTNQGLAAAKTLPGWPEQFKNRKNRSPHRSVVVFFFFFVGGGWGGVEGLKDVEKVKCHSTITIMTRSITEKFHSMLHTWEKMS
jgi:hypothetical protein